jgi:two-component system sensor histidine kinase KdpD
MRTALLAAVSHDLRSPLASAKAAVTSLRSRTVRWTDAERAELLATAEESLEQLTRLIENLLDMSRLQAGALAVAGRPVALDELVPRLLDDLGPGGHEVTVDVPEALPEVIADAALLERVLANLLANALRHSPPGHPPTIAASAHAGRVEIRVIDRGPGVATEDRERIFQPFQRLGDRDNTTGVGLGLALSRGLTEAMGGTLHADDTPGGGLTMTVSLPAADQPGPRPVLEEEPQATPHQVGMP